jgi:hypothetical protein
MVMKELDTPRDTFIHLRGAYDKPGERVVASTPASLPEIEKKRLLNRLDLAHWIVDRNHPLTARVAVNRYWQMYFGTGLVKTTEDFGTQGEPSRAARLAGIRIHRFELGCEGHAAIDGPKPDLSTVVENEPTCP